MISARICCPPQMRLLAFEKVLHAHARAHGEWISLREDNAQQRDAGKAPFSLFDPGWGRCRLSPLKARLFEIAFLCGVSSHR
jgi:hypothetical protein